MMNALPSAAPRDYKEEARKQWTADPCGFPGGQGHEPGSPEYFAAIDYDRYESHAPWLKGVMPFHTARGKKVLEIGYGQGTDLMQFARGGAHVSGVDLSTTHQRLAQRRFELAGIDADLRIADAESLPFSDTSFDVVYSLGVIHHTPGTQAVIDEIHRVLRPGGRAILGVYHRHSIFSLYKFIQWISNGWWKTETLDESYWRIEAQSEDRGARTLVKRYGRWEFRKMLRAFRSVDFRVDHYGMDPRYFPTRVIPPDIRNALAKVFGWYLIAFCEK
jgi:ubiquinone/menaquinone biosynthesis C-methylase UbiE